MTIMLGKCPGTNDPRECVIEPHETERDCVWVKVRRPGEDDTGWAVRIPKDVFVAGALEALSGLVPHR